LEEEAVEVAVEVEFHITMVLVLLGCIRPPVEEEAVGVLELLLLQHKL
jgi:hypothetical protein